MVISVDCYKKSGVFLHGYQLSITAAPFSHGCNALPSAIHFHVTKCLELGLDTRCFSFKLPCRHNHSRTLTTNSEIFSLAKGKCFDFKVHEALYGNGRRNYGINKTDNLTLRCVRLTFVSVEKQ